MTATGKATRYPRTFGLPWVSEVPQQAARVGLSGSLLLLERDPALEVAGTFAMQRGGNSQSVCQADWRVEGIAPNPVLAEHFKNGVLPSGQVFFAAGAVEVPVSFLLSPGADPPTELAGQVVLENLVNCEIAAGRGVLPLSIAAAVITDDAVVGLEVSFTVLEPVKPAPVLNTKVPPENLDQYLWGPYPTLTTVAATPSNLQDKLTNAAAGQLIELADGTYNGNYTSSKNGTAANPIVIRAKNLNKALFSPDGMITVSGDWTAVDGMKFTGPTITRVKLDGNHNRCTRCEFSGAGWQNETKCISFSGDWVHIDRNDMHDCQSGFCRWNDCFRPWIERNWIHHCEASGSGAPAGAEHNEMIQIGQSSSDHATEVYAVVEYNLLEDFGDLIDVELFSVKSSRGVYYRNTLRNNGISGYTKRCQLQNRGGENNQYIANTLVGHQIQLCARGQRVWSNKVSGAGNGISLSGGTIAVPPGGSPGDSNMAQLIDCQLADNDCQKIYLSDNSFAPARPKLGPDQTVFSQNQPNYINGVEVHDKSKMTVGEYDNGTTYFNRNTAFVLETPKALAASEVGNNYPEPAP